MKRPKYNKGAAAKLDNAKRWAEMIQLDLYIDVKHSLNLVKIYWGKRDSKGYIICSTTFFKQTTHV